jgi:hypothetical protein
MKTTHGCSALPQNFTTIGVLRPQVLGREECERSNQSDGQHLGSCGAGNLR